jgi:hypothetical protein
MTMKIHFIAIFLSIIFIETINAQNEFSNYLPVKNDKVLYTGIVKVDSVSKDELYKRVKSWVITNCDLIITDDGNTIAAKGLIDTYDITLKYTIRLDIKDGCYKYVITNIRIIQTNCNCGMEDKPIEKYFVLGSIKSFYKNINLKIDNLISNIGTAMITKLDDNW